MPEPASSFWQSVTIFSNTFLFLGSSNAGVGGGGGAAPISGLPFFVLGGCSNSLSSRTNADHRFDERAVNALDFAGQFLGQRRQRQRSTCLLDGLFA